MTELRSHRRQIGLSQAELADILRVALNSFRMWDSGLRPTPRDVLELARIAAADALRDQQLLNLPDLATELKVHVRTLQAAARTGRLEVQYAARSVFGRPRRLSTRAAGRVFLQTYYKRYRGQPIGRFALPPAVPKDYGSRLRRLRNCLKLSQADLAELVGAASKAVVYQWESGKRVPSPIFWGRVLAVGRAAVASSPRVPLRLDQGARSSVG